MEIDDSALFIERCFFNELPDEVIEYIFGLLPPYQDLEQCMLVCKRWHKNVLNVIFRKKNNLSRAVCNFSIKWAKVSQNPSCSEITKRYSHSACSNANFMYVFGGCTSNSTTFNDLWCLNLSTRKWRQMLTLGTCPTPKACATIVYYGDTLVLFGGWTHPSPYPLHQQWRMFNELHIYEIASKRWTCVTSPDPAPPPMAGHSATIHRDTMVVFGGLHDTRGSSNDIWCFDLVTCTWRTQETSEPKPLARYGQSQIILDDDHLIILGGCGGVPNTVLNDVWLLEMTSDVWKWHQININNSQWAAPHLWCHPACKIGDKVVVFSRNPLSSVPRFAYSRWSPSHPRGQAPVVSDEPENGQRLRRHLSINIKGKMTVKVDHAVDHQRIDRDVNINGKGGSEPPRVSQVVNATGSSNQEDAEAGPSSSRNNLESDRAQNTNSINVSATEEPLEHEGPRVLLLGNANDSKGRGDIVMIRTGGERLPTEANTNLVPISIHADEFVPMAMFVMDIAHVLTDHQVSWLPLKSIPDGSPEDTILFTLVVGNGELIMFGGIQIDATSMTLNIQSSMNISNTVSNELHFITAPTDII